MTSKKQPAVYVDCPGVTNDGVYAHSMRDYCWSCAPFWERIPTCPTDGSTLKKSGFCKICRKYFKI